MRTYDEIFRAMTDKYTELSGIIPDESSDISIRLRVLAGELYSGEVNTEWLKRQMFASTAQGDYLDLHAKERGIARRGAAHAYGTVIFSVSEAPAGVVVIPKGTVVASVGSLLRFETILATAIYPGKTSATVTVKSVGQGKKYNVLSGSVSVIVNPPSGVDAVTNPNNFFGGCDRESDESLRKRVIESIKSPVNSTNCTYYKTMAESVTGVSSAGVVPKERGIGTVNVYVAADGSRASSETVGEVQKLLSQQREVNVDVLVKEATSARVNLYLRLEVAEGYDFNTVRDECVEALSSYIESQGVGGEVLLCKVGEILSHISGVKEFGFVPQLNSDFRASNSKFPVAGTISILRGTV